MQFVTTNIGLINIALVERIERSHKGAAILHLGDTAATTLESYDDFEESLGTIVPNTTGVQAVSFDVVGEYVEHWQWPIVAWRIARGGAVPILATPVACDFLLLPDGSVEELFVQTFSSLNEAKQEILARAKKGQGTA